MDVNFAIIFIGSDTVTVTMDNCTCETTSVLVNASIYGDPENVTTEIWCPEYNECCNLVVA